MKEDISSTGKKIVKNLFLLITGNVAAQLLGFLSVIYLARILKADGFGKVVFAQGIVAYFFLFSDLGLKTFGTIEIARVKGEQKRYVNNIVTMRIALSIAAFLMLLLITLLMDKPQDQKYLIILFGISIFPSTILLDWFFQGIQKMGIIGLTNMLKSLFYITFLLLFLSSGDILYIPIYFTVSFILAMVPMFLTFFREHGWIVPSFEYTLWKESIIKAIPLGLSSIMIQIYYNIDTVMLGFMKGEEAVGLYNAAYKIVLLLLGFASIIGMVLLPNVSKIYTESKENIEKYLRYLSKITIFWSIPVTVGGMILSGQIIRVFYGEYYNNSVIPLQILIWSVFTVFSNIPFALLLLASGKGKEYMYSVTAGAVSNLSLNLFLIPRYDLIGASISTLISEFIVLTFLLLYSRRLIIIPMFRNILLGLTASSIMGILLLNLNDKFNLLISILLGILIYILTLIIIKGVNKEDLVFIREALKIKGS